MTNSVSGTLDLCSPTRKWKPGDERASLRLCRELSTHDPRTRSQTGPFPHSMSRIYNRCKNEKENTRDLTLVHKGYEASQGARLPGQTLHTESPGQCPSQGPLPAASTHTQCQCVRTYARSPPWEPATSLCQRPLILPMWLRVSGILREGVGRNRRSGTTSADSSFMARPSSALPLWGLA